MLVVPANESRDTERPPASALCVLLLDACNRGFFSVTTVMVARRISCWLPHVRKQKFETLEFLLLIFMYEAHGEKAGMHASCMWSIPAMYLVMYSTETGSSICNLKLWHSTLVLFICDGTDDATRKQSARI